MMSISEEMERAQMLETFRRGLEVLSAAITLECELLDDLINQLNFELLIKNHSKLDALDISLITTGAL